MRDPAEPSASTAGYRTILAKSVSRAHRFVDPWFVAHFGMNLYRGCEHGCAYCDGRAEKYRVEGDFARDVVVKANAPAVLAGELARVREPGFVFVGGGVCDAYQPAERSYRLARQALELVARFELPVHVLTKSALVERDFDLLEAIDAKKRAIVSFSIQTVDDRVRAHFEPGASPIEERFRVLAEAKRRGFGVGVMAMPVLPGVSDQPAQLDELMARAAQVGADFVLCGGLTLRPGVQTETYLRAVESFDPALLPGYRKLYRSMRASGSGDARYYQRLEQRLLEARLRHGLPGRIPRRLFHGLIPGYTEIAVLLEHVGFERACEGLPDGRLDRAGMAIQQWSRRRLAKDRRLLVADLERELVSMLEDGSIASLPEVTPDAVAVIRELLSD